jgi:probable phosphoglycerate mutase
MGTSYRWLCDSRRVTPTNLLNVVANGVARILMVRHGQSEWNAIGKWQGQEDPPLTELGVDQAMRAGQVLGSFDLIASSDLQRAAITATVIGELIGIGPVHVDDRLRETFVGPWQGLTRHQIEAQWPGWIKDGRRPPEAETETEVAIRAHAALIDLAAQIGSGEIFVVSHGGTIRALKRHLGGSDERFGNLEGSWFTVQGSEISHGESAYLLDHTGADETL